MQEAQMIGICDISQTRGVGFRKLGFKRLNASGISCSCLVFEIKKSYVIIFGLNMH